MSRSAQTQCARSSPPWRPVAATSSAMLVSRTSASSAARKRILVPITGPETVPYGTSAALRKQDTTHKLTPRPTHTRRVSPLMETILSWPGPASRPGTSPCKPQTSRRATSSFAFPGRKRPSHHGRPQIASRSRHGNRQPTE